MTMNEDFWTVDLGQGMGPIRLGAARSEVLQCLAEAGIEVDAENEEPEWAYIDDAETALIFKAAEPHVLREITVEDERVRLGPLTVMGQRLHKVVELLQVTDAETLWRTTDDEEDDRTSPSETASQPPPDRDLLRRGTLWIPSLGLGLELWRGEVTLLRLRQPEDAPRTGVGALTAAQREILAREDLSDYLAGSTSVDGARGGGCLQKLLTLGLLISLGVVGWRAFDYQRRWHASPTVEGEVIAVEPPPPEPFPDKYTIAYQDLAGGQHQVVWTRNKVYGIHKVGDKIELRYLPEAPERPVNPPDVSDEAFITFLPWGIGIFVAYLALQFAISIAGLLARRRTVEVTLKER